MYSSYFDVVWIYLLKQKYWYCLLFIWKKKIIFLDNCWFEMCKKIQWDYFTNYSMNVVTLPLLKCATKICLLFYLCNFCDILAEIWWPKRLCIMQLCPSAETWAGIISKWNKKIKFRSNASTLTLPLCTQKNLQHLKIGTYESILFLHFWIINAEKYALQVFMH